MQQFIPMRLTSLREPFNRPDWIFELKYDGFRALAHVDGSGCRLISRNLNTYKSYADLAAAIAAELRGHTATLDGELVCLDPQGRPQFYDLLRRRGTTHFYAFDVLELDGRDLRQLPLLERKRILRDLIGPACRRLLYVDHVDGRGVDLYHAACQRDLEGIVAKWKHGAYHCGDVQPLERRLALHATNPSAASKLTWIKIKNPAYSQTAGREEFFKKRATTAR